MKAFTIAIILVVLLISGYLVAIFAGIDLPKPGFLDKGIEGNAQLKVTLLMDNNLKNPVNNVEVDIALKPGQPPKGGVAVTDELGIATFKIKPGTYYIYFNENTFPKNLKVPELKQVTVDEKTVKEVVILIDTNN